MDTEDLFESPKALLKWAYEDTQRFKELERAFFDGDPYDQIEEFDEKTGRNAHRIRFQNAVPDEMRKLSSHIINDLRHALDQGFVTAARHFGWQKFDKVRSIYFPWATCQKSLEGMLRGWKIPVEINPIIFEAVPYPAQNDGAGGNDIVRQLGKIAGPNKHEAALSAYAVARVTELHVKWTGDWIIPYFGDMWDNAKQELTLGYYPVGSKGNYDADLAMMIVFRDIPELSGHAASDLFEYWGAYANHFVERFERRVIEAATA